MKVEFQKIRWKNFLSTGNNFTEVILNKSPNTLIVGQNGAGKSTILDALCFGLFGKPYRKINKPQLVNTVNNKHCLVEIEFVVGSTSYKIRRGIKPEVFEIFKNGQLVDQTSKRRDYQQYLESHIINFNYQSFTQIVILGSGSFIPFMKLPATSRPGQYGRRDIIEELLDLKVFTTMNTILKDRISDHQLATENNKTEISSLTEKIKLIESFIEESEQAAKATIDEKEKHLEVIKDTLIQNNNHYQLITEQWKSIKLDQKIKSRFDKAALTKYDLQNAVDQINHMIEFYDQNDHCPTCKQGIEQQYKGLTVGKLKKKRITIEQNIDIVNKKIEEYQLILDQQQILQNKKDNIKNDIQHVMFNIKQNKIDISNIEHEIKQLKTNVGSITKYKKELKNCQRKLENAYEKRTQLNEFADVLATAGALLKDKGIKTQIIKQYIPIFNQLIAKYLQSMDFFCNFELNERFEETIKSRHRDIFTYDSFSEGEKARIDLALLFTWRSISKMKSKNHTNLLILDETFDSSLDQNGGDFLMKLIYDLGKEINVFVISHKQDSLYDKFYSVIKFEKVKNFSHIVQ